MRENDLLQYISGHNADLPASVVIPPGDDMGAIRLEAESGDAWVGLTNASGDVRDTSDRAVEASGGDSRGASGGDLSLSAAQGELPRTGAQGALPGAAARGKLPGGGGVLVTVDQVADGVHVDLTTMPIGLVGRKCVTRSLSDVAAMAARPVAAVAAVCLPRAFGQDRATELFDAMRATAEHYGCPLIGGDISVWDGAMIATVTVFALPGGIEPVLRSGARPGDGVFVTGALGHSLSTGHHLGFEPRLTLARALAGDPPTRPTAMMDLSDGLGTDLPRLVEHAQIDAASLPLRPRPRPRKSPRKFPPRDRGRQVGPGSLSGNAPGSPPESTRENPLRATGPQSEGLPEGDLENPESSDSAWRHAVGDGEDYELLFTASPDAPIPPSLGGVPITRIGQVRDAGGVVIRLPGGTTQPLAGLGWEHTG